MKTTQQKELIAICEELRTKASITFHDFDKIGDKIFRLSLKIDELWDSRENLRNTIKELRNQIKELKLKGGKKK